MITGENTIAGRGRGSPTAPDAFDISRMKGVDDLTLLEFFSEAVVAIDEAASIVFFNSAAEELFGYERHQVLDRSLEILIPPTSRSAHRQHLAAFAQSSEVGRRKSSRRQLKGLRKDGRTFDAEVSILKVRLDRRMIMMAVVQDVSERKEREAALRAAEAKHRALLDSCGDAILCADVETGLIVEVNERAGDLFGCASTALVGLHFTQLHPETERARLERQFREHTAEQRTLTSEAWIARVDGSLIPVEISARPATIGETRILVGFFRDIRHRKKREEDLIEAQRAALAANRTKSDFLANLSHELRTPLNAVIGFAEAIEKQVFGPLGTSKYADYARDIAASGSHLLTLINDILDLSRIESGKQPLYEEVLDCGLLVVECSRSLREVARESGIRLEWETQDAPLLWADERAVRQMLLNLLSNAIKFTPPGGLVRVAIRHVANGPLCLEVRDTGVGMTAEQVAKATEPFNSFGNSMVAKLGGTGLGLAITKGLIESHDGSLELASVPGEGTCVALCFPAARVRSTRAVGSG